MNDLVVVKKEHKKRNDCRDIGITPDDVRRGLLEAAGITREEMGAALRKAFDTASEQMDALKSTTFSFRGKSGDTVFDSDNAQRLKASELIMKFVDQMPRGKVQTDNAPAPVSINLPAFYTAEIIRKENETVINVEASDDG